MATQPPDSIFSGEPITVPVPELQPDDSEPAHAEGAWVRLTRALGRDLGGGISRAEQARRRIARMKH